MKTVPVLVFLMLLHLYHAVGSTLEEGLCLSTPNQCPNSVQRKGVCCRRPRDRRLIYYANSCLACLSGCDSFYYKTLKSTNCDDRELQGL